VNRDATDNGLRNRLFVDNLKSMPKRPPARPLKPTPLGNRLRDARERGELSARELCLLSGVTVSVAAMIERGHIHRPGVDNLAAFARTLGVSLDWLVLGVGDEPTTDQIRKAVEEARARQATPQAPQAPPEAAA
jgi:transcriptional regulator with XRE-family HTH domain